jgi:putative nucleotidyltransferase with HDIG domain
MERNEALEIARKYTRKDITFRHLISVEGVMRALARHFSEDEDRWGYTGLFHDLDYDETADDFERHTHLTVEWLKEEGFDDELARCVNRRDLRANFLISVREDAYPLIGQRFNLTRERVRQIKEKALRKLRQKHRREELQVHVG